MKNLQELVESVNSLELAGKSYGAREWLSILFSRFSGLKYATEWIESEKYTGVDVRPMVLFRVESATIWYEQNIVASVELCNQYERIILDHGYEREFAIKHAANLREIQNRVGYLDSVYFAFDYFVSQMLKIHGIEHKGQNKVSDFEALLGYFSMETSGSTKRQILSDIQFHLPESMSGSVDALVEPSDGLVTFQKSFEYLTLIRNSLHNNGFANKNMNNLVIGPFKYRNIKKNESLWCLSLPHLLVLILQIVNCIEQLCERSVCEVPSNHVDPNLQSLHGALGFYP